MHFVVRNGPNCTVSQVVFYHRGLGSVPMHMRIVVDKVALGQVFLSQLWFSSVIIIPPMLRTHFYVWMKL